MEFRSKTREYQREYIREYMAKRRIQKRKPIEIVENGYKYILLRALQPRLETKNHPVPSFRGHVGYVLGEVRKVIG